MTAVCGVTIENAMGEQRDSHTGLCATCAHVQVVQSSKASTFYLCRLSEVDARFPRYPTLPVRQCAGYELTPPEGDSTIRRVPAPRITKEDLKQRLDGPTPPVIVDARLKYPYEHSTVRLPGAVRYAAGAHAPSLPRDREIVVYDSDPNELASSRVAADLIRQGYKAVTLKGGIVEWLEAKLPIETKEAPKQAAPEPGSLKA